MLKMVLKKLKNSNHSYIVNPNEISKYIRGEGGYLVMSDSPSVDVSRSRKDILSKNYTQASIILPNPETVV